MSDPSPDLSSRSRAWSRGHHPGSAGDGGMRVQQLPGVVPLAPVAGPAVSFAEVQDHAAAVPGLPADNREQPESEAFDLPDRTSASVGISGRDGLRSYSGR